MEAWPAAVQVIPLTVATALLLLLLLLLF